MNDSFEQYLKMWQLKQELKGKGYDRGQWRVLKWLDCPRCLQDIPVFTCVELKVRCQTSGCYHEVVIYSEAKEQE